MQIRTLGPGDAEEVLRAADLFDEPLSPRAVGAYLADDRNVFLLAYQGDAVVGFLRGTELGQLKTDRKQMFLYEIAVAVSHRRKGIGSALIRALERNCQDRGVEEIFVFTDDPANAAAAGLYRSTGAVTETRGDRMYVYRLR
jgi:ribosomal protein S18 acetylase RimI-like enzyme